MQELNANMDVRKPLRARKTMTPSSRKQVEMLKKLKKGAEAVANGPSTVDNRVHLKSIETNCLYQNSLKGHDHNPESKQTLLPHPTLKEPLSNIVVNSQISIYNGSREEAGDLPYNGCTANSDVKQFLNAGALQNILYQYLEKESNSPFFKPVEVHLNAKPPRQLSSQLEEQFSVTSPTTEVPASDEVTGITDTTHAKQFIPVLEQEGNNFRFPKKNVTASSLPDGPQRKRKTSESNEDAVSRRIKTSDEAKEGSDARSAKMHSGLGKAKCFIQRQLNNSMQSLDHSLQDLNERIDRTQCLRKHEEIAIRIVKKISRLDKRINAAITFQKTELSKQQHNRKIEFSTAGAPSQNRVSNCTDPHSGAVNGTLAPSKEMSSNANANPPTTTKNSDDVICLAAWNKNADVEAVNSADVQTKQASVSTDTSAETPCNAKNLILIDLTDEASDHTKGADKEKEKGAAKQRNATLESLASNPPKLALPSSDQVLSQFLHLPPLPRVDLQLEHPNRFGDTLPPQKLELSVAQVHKPKGVGLRWNITKLDPRCAPIHSFHLFVCLEYANRGAPSDWMKTGEIDAKSLPMACSLAQVPSRSTCYFAMQSKDVYGRYGPFCDIKSIDVV